MPKGPKLPPGAKEDFQPVRRAIHAVAATLKKRKATSTGPKAKGIDLELKILRYCIHKLGNVKPI